MTATYPSPIANDYREHDPIRRLEIEIDNSCMRRLGRIILVVIDRARQPCVTAIMD